MERALLGGVAQEQGGAAEEVWVQEAAVWAGCKATGLGQVLVATACVPIVGSGFPIKQDPPATPSTAQLAAPRW